MPEDDRPSRFRGAILLCALLAGALLPAGLAALSPEPWIGPAFSADPAALVQAAATVPGDEGEGVAVLLLESTYRYDEAGRETFTQRIVYRILSAAAHESWSTVEERWSPWHQARPEIRARVLTPDGAEHGLDPATIAENAVAQEAPDLFEDGRVLRAPLPAIRPGSVVEQEVTVRDTAPFFDRGVVRYQGLDTGVSVRHARVVVDAPAGTPLRWVVRGAAGVSPVESVAEGRRRVTFEARDLPAPVEPEPGLPPEVPRSAYVAFSTGASWADVARRYSEIVDQALHGADLRSFLRSAGGPASSQLDLMRTYLARVSQEIRYTGVELGEGGLVPRKPAETLRRKFGDCKDKAVLLTAMLRASEIPAYVALLSAGEGGQDVEDSLPGLGAFNHAIVVVPGNPAVWIDPTDPYARAGELPAGDQGRLALIASPSTTGLVRTPEATAAENREVETREIYLAGLGKARVVETTEYRGQTERELRAFYATADPKELRTSFEEYVSTAYLAGGLTALEHSKPDDLSQPLRLRLEAEEAGSGMTDVQEAAVAILPASLLGRLPEELSLPDEDREGPRTSDYVFTRPLSIETRYKVVPPAGFVPQPLPESRVRRFGPVALAEEYAVEGDGAIAAVVRLDVDKRRITAGEFEEIRRGVLAMEEDKPVLLQFEQVGEAHLAAGRVREALEEFERLAAREPKKALPRTRIARALLAGGMGEAAREEARKAIRLEPGFAPAHRDLGWILQHDEIGRRFGPGFDRAGALAAYAKAKELDPEDWIARGDLAILLEHNGRGERYGPGCDLAAAIEEYRSLREDLENTALDDNLQIALLRAERFQEVRELAAEIAETQNRSTLTLVATAALDGPEAALRESARRFQDDATRITVLSSAAQNLIALRRYPEAAALLERASRQSSNAAALLTTAEMLRKARRSEELAFSSKDPVSATKRLVQPFFSDPFDAKAFLSFFSRPSRSRLAGEEAAIREGFGIAVDQIRKMVRERNVSLQTAMELGLASFRETVTGEDATGYRVRLENPAAEGFGVVAYLVPEDGEYRVAGLQTTLWVLGAEALRRLDAGDLRGARQWLDWAHEEIGTAKGEDPLSGSPFTVLWTKGREASGDEIRCAATVLAANDLPLKETEPVLLACREAAGNDDARATALDLTLARVYRTAKRSADLLTVARRLRTAAPDSAAAYSLESIALFDLERRDEVRKIAEEKLRASPGDPGAIHVLYGLAERNGDLETAQSLLLDLTRAGRATAGDFNNLAWIALVRGQVDETAIEQGQRAATLTGYKDPGSLHTLAALYAEQGKTAEAYRILLQSLEAKADQKPDSDDWFVFGQLAERYGLPDVARRYYERIPPSGDKSPLATYHLARQRLAALGVGKDRKPVKAAGL